MLLNNLMILLAMMFLLWLISQVRRDVSIIDPVWGVGFVVIAWATCIQNWPVSGRMLLVTSLVTIWGIRLWGYLFWRGIGEPEDSRYAAMRDKHDDRFWWVSLITVFGLQAFLLWLIAFPIQYTAASAEATSLGWLDAVGVLLWLVGFFFESVGDWQLARFRGNPDNRGKVLDSGLWRYTRHPNYFGDFCVWWGFYLLSIGAGAGWTIFSPLVMSILLMKISGVTLLEKNISERRPEYSSYKARTSSFFPWRPKNNNC